MGAGDLVTLHIEMTSDTSGVLHDTLLILVCNICMTGKKKLPGTGTNVSPFSMTTIVAQDIPHVELHCGVD